MEYSSVLVSKRTFGDILNSVHYLFFSEQVQATLIKQCHV